MSCSPRFAESLLASSESAADWLPHDGAARFIVAPMQSITARQFHNQPERSHQHRYLAALWDEVRSRTDGALDVTVHAHNGGVPGSDPQALAMLVEGEIAFATFMGPLLASLHPALETQGVPFVFRDSTAAHAAVDGALGDYLRDELATRGVYLVPHGALENGVRQILSIRRKITTLDDLEGFRMRVPATRIIRDCFDALGCTTVTVNVGELGAALASGIVDGHENPLAIVDANGLESHTAHVARSNHIWSGFNVVANLPFWQRLPATMQAVVQAATRTHVARQRADTIALNARLEGELARRGILFSAIDAGQFRARLGQAFYHRVRDEVGERAWQLLQHTGDSL